MQPYIFPYIGYFHLIQAIDLFVFYDDVHFIKRGWINRNKLLNNGQEWLMTVPLHKASQNDLIKDVVIHPELYPSWKEKTLQTIQHAYAKAPYFEKVFPLIKTVFDNNSSQVSELAIASIIKVYDYLGVPFAYSRSSEISPETRGMGRADRLIQIIKDQGYTNYVNAAGGRELYDKGYYNDRGVSLFFVNSKEIRYQQFNEPFIPYLSIIDVLMFNDIPEAKKLLNAYELV